MVYHFVKHIGFDIKADSLEQAKEIAEFIDDDTSNIEDAAYDSMVNAIDDALDVGVLREDFYDNCDVHAGDSEYVGYTEDADDPEERLYDYLTDDDDDYDDSDDDEDYDEDEDDDEYDDSDDMISDEKYFEALASRIAYALISSLV